MAVTFTKKAATEMQERLAKLQMPGARSLLVCTFHSLAYQVLRQNFRLVGLRAPPTIYTEDEDLMKILAEAMRWDHADFQLLPS